MDSTSKYILEALEPRVLLSVDLTGGVAAASTCAVVVEQSALLDSSPNTFHDNTYNIMNDTDDLFDQSLYQDLAAVVEQGQDAQAPENDAVSSAVIAPAVQEITVTDMPAASSTATHALVRQSVTQVVTGTTHNNDNATTETRVLTLDAANAPPHVDVVGSAQLRVLTLDASNAPPSQVFTAISSFSQSDQIQLQDASSSEVITALSVGAPVSAAPLSTISPDTTSEKTIIEVNELPRNSSGTTIIGGTDCSSVIEIGSPVEDGGSPFLLTDSATFMTPQPGGEVHINKVIIGSPGASLVIYGSGHTTT